MRKGGVFVLLFFLARDGNVDASSGRYCVGRSDDYQTVLTWNKTIPFEGQLFWVKLVLKTLSNYFYF